VTLRIGTRRSRLALAQANEIASALDDRGTPTVLVPMVTSGDRGADPSTDPAGMKGLFVTEIVHALERGEIDVAVHSAKDLPAEDDDALTIAAVPPRVSPLDVLVTREGSLEPGGRVGTSSVRRQAQVFRWRPDVLLKDLRGNVDTRLRKLADGEADAIVLAAAGLLRLGIVPEHVQPMSIAEMVPAPGQGTVAVQARADDASTLDALAPLDHAESREALTAERTLMRALGGGCALPLGAFAERSTDGRMRMVAIVLTPEGSRYARTEVEADTPEQVAELARLDLAAGGADEILAVARG
jgi:hydroxymethylbilane synthase